MSKFGDLIRGKSAPAPAVAPPAPAPEPVVVEAPAPEPEQPEQPVDNSTNSGGETGGFIPNIPARNFDNKYAFLAYKLYQVTPC